MADNYVCTLDEASIKKAKAELNEDPRDRISAVEALRKFLREKCPHIKCPQDTSYLLLFLRARKFSQLEACNLIEKYLTTRTKLSKWAADLDPSDPKIQKTLESGLWIAPKKRDKDGRRLLFIRPGLDIKALNIPKDDFLRAMCCVLWYVYLDENTSVNGTNAVFDATGFSMFHQQFLTLEERKSLLGMWQKSFPARVKSFHLYNLGAFGDFVFMIIKLAMTEKIQKRVVNNGAILESLYKNISMECFPEEYLPDDYTGPNAGTTQEIIETMKKEMASPEICERIKLYSSSQFSVDLNKKPVNVPQESFRKLNVD